MRKAVGRMPMHMSKIAAYGCVGMAVAFVLALTLGMFDASTPLQRIAANTNGGTVISTP